MPALRYERVNDHDLDDPQSPDSPTTPGQQQPIPNSPPPSFHSRASSIQSREHGNRVDPDLADAFDAEDDSDDEADDTQRLVRGTSTPGSNTPPSSTADSTRQAPSSVPAPQPPRSTTHTPLRVYGGGIQSDGVFSNITARPETGEVKEEQPPTYEQAAADAAPPYWETTILAPGLGGPDDVFIDGMPVGPIFSFLWNLFISWSIQPFVGFLLTYLLHSSHAAKNGSRAGLGLQLIQTGFSLKGATIPGGGGMGGGGGGGDEGYAQPPDPNSHDFDPETVTGGGSSGDAGIAGTDWAAYILMIVGWFILIRSVADYVRARRHEQLVLQSPDRGLGIPIIAEGEVPDRVV